MSALGTFCETCNRTFSKPFRLREHIAAVHEKKKDYKCPYCPFASAQKSNLQQHTCMKRRGHDGKIQYEAVLQAKLAAETKGTMKKCGIGFVDLVTATEIIEIKLWADYYKAIGQIIMYAVFFPGLKKRIHFFGTKPKQAIQDAIKAACEKHEITVTCEEN